MRVSGHYEVDSTHPSARGVCDRCGQIWSHKRLQWQFDWRGPRLQNLRLLVCPDCVDEYQQNGQRTILIPPDPIPIMNARPENYVADNNPLSAIGVGANWDLQTTGTRIGNLVNGGNINAAFDGNPYKASFLSAGIAVANSSYNNYVGINWTGNNSVLNLPSSLGYPMQAYAVASFQINAPIDSTFGSTAYAIQGSPTGGQSWTSWTTIASGSPAGVVGEVISGQTTGGSYQFHRAAFYGGSGTIAVAQVEFNVSNGPTE